MAYQMPERILALQVKRIGDAVLTAPAIALLQESFPKSSLTLVLSSAAAQLGKAFCCADELLTYRPGQLNLSIWSRIMMGKFDTCLDFSGNDRSALMARLSGAKHRFGYQKFADSKPLRRTAFTELCNASVRELHTVDFHLALVRMIPGTARLASESGFTVPDSAKAAATSLKSKLGERYAVVHPGTARTEKYWVAKRWANVIDHLQRERGIPCALTGNLDNAERSCSFSRNHRSRSYEPPQCCWPAFAS